MKSIVRILSFILAAIILAIVVASVAAGLVAIAALLVECWVVIRTLLIAIVTCVAVFGFWIFAVPWAWARIFKANNALSVSEERKETDEQH